MRSPARLSAVSALLAAVLLTAACGSQLDPAAAAAAGGGDATTGSSDSADAPVSGGEVPGGSSVPDGTSGGTDTGGGTSAGGNDPGTPSSGGGGGGDTPSAPDDAAPPAGDVKAGSCDGLKNQTGITDDKIVLANVSDVSGPVPGIFAAAQQGAKAFVQYFNATTDLCGRKIELLNLDSRADASADQQAYARACDEAFAVIGSMSAFDSGGAATAQSCGIPDIRSGAVNTLRQKCSTCFATQALAVNLVGDAMPRFFSRLDSGATKKAAVLAIDAGAAPANADSFAVAFEKAGWDVVYREDIGVAEFNYASYVQQMKSKGVQTVGMTGAIAQNVRLAQTMTQQGFKPKFYFQDGTIYNDDYVAQAGGAGEGVYAYINWTPYDSNVAEMKLYRSWLNQVSPGDAPDGNGVYAWSAARLFVELATKLGGSLTRESLVGELRKVSNWTANDLHAPASVGAKRTSACVRVMQLSGSSWKQVSKGDYECGKLIDTGIS